MILLPDTTSKLLMSWSGPYPVLERHNSCNYLINENGKHKLYHTNLLKRYHRRAHVNQFTALDEPLPILDESTNITFSPLEEETAEHPGPSPITPDGREDAEESNTIPKTEPSLTVTQRIEISAVLDEFPDVLSESPGCTSTLMHDIEVCSTERVKARLYPIPIHLKPYFEEEVDQLLQQGIIQPSISPHRSPIVMVKKANGSYRMAIDFRALNFVTVFHAESITTMTEDIHKFYGSKYFSELDLIKAYNQVPLTERPKP